MLNLDNKKLAAVALATLAAVPAYAAEKEDVLVVTASGFQQKIEDSPASISVIPREQLEEKAYRDVTDALKDVPGVVVTGGGSTSDISIRGMASKYTLILVDGKRVDSRGTRPNSDGPGIEQGWLPPLESIERIEVVRGPMSSLYGSDAMGGVINIITKKNTKKWTAAVRSDMTIQEDSDSGNIYQTNVYAAGPLIDNVLGVRVNGLISRRAEDKILNGYNEQRMRSGGAVFTLTPDEKNVFDLEVGRSLQDRNSHPGKTIAEGGTASETRYERSNYSLTHSGVYDFGTSTSYIQFEDTKNPSRDMEMKNTIFNTQASFLAGDHTLVAGGQYRYEDLRDEGNQLASAATLNKLTRWSWALFLEDEWQIVDDFALTGGIRMDKDENYGTHWTPRLYGVWHPHEEWTIKGGVSTGYRSPDLRQAVNDWGQISGGGGDPAIIVGNSALKPEKSTSEEISVMWNNQEGFTAGVTLFNTDFKDKITEVRRCTDSTGKASGQCSIDGNNYKYISDRVNVDKANMRGVETTVGWDITSDLTLASSYTFTDSEQKSGSFKGKPLNQMPRHMFNTTLDWKTTDELGTWVRVNYRGRTSDYLGRTSMADGTPSYTFVDVGATYKLNKNVQLLGGVYNVLDKRVDYDTYNTVLDGRRYTVGVNVNF